MKQFASQLTPGEAGQGSCGTVADVSDPARTATQQMPRFVTVITSKYGRHR